jgi:uncharacterized radical SAM protein YgiQ
MFLPTTRDETKSLGWDRCDVILVTGDSYIDSPFSGAAVIGRLLERAGYRVGVIAQPDISNVDDIGRLGTPRLFWGVTAGSVDSMVANYTALKKKRKSDDYTPGGVNNRRPDRATIVYTNLIRRFMNRVAEGGGRSEQPAPPIVLGGIEASLRRVAHYDFWSDRVRGSILFDAKADYLLYGMAEKAVLELAACLEAHGDPRQIRGLCYIAKEKPPTSPDPHPDRSRECLPPAISHLPFQYLDLPSFETVSQDKLAFIEMFHTFYRNNDPLTARGLCQKHGDRILVQNPPAAYPTQEELDAVYALPFERGQPPYYARLGPVKALETIRFSIATHRGCYGECNFCAIAVHEGRTVRWRSQESILKEAEGITRHPEFKGILQDLGGPTANMYGFECKKKLASGSCPKKRCLSPSVCPVLKVDHRSQMEILEKVRRLPGVRKVFVASGIRYDLLLADQDHGEEYLRRVAAHHVSGQMKVAPEHTEEHVLEKMGKPGKAELLKFKRKFDRLSQAAGKPQFLTYYLIAAHPGCSEADMQQLKRFTSLELGANPEQVQIFTPTPSTYSTLMYYTEMDPFTLQPVFVEKDPRRKERQKEIVTRKGRPENDRRRPLKNDRG